MKNIVVVGATSGIAIACARRWNSGPVSFTLVGRSGDRLQAVADDLRVRNPQATTVVLERDLVDATAVSSTVEGFRGDPIDLVLIAQGTLPEQQSMRDTTATAKALGVNAISPALWAEAFANLLEERGRGTIVMLGSVAGDRGRRSNYTYGAAKSLVDTFARGLQHRLAGTDVHVLLVKPGPTRTSMTAHLDGSTSLASPDSVAQDIDRAARAHRRVLYTPAKWRPIMSVVRAMPDAIFDRLNL